MMRKGTVMYKMYVPAGKWGMTEPKELFGNGIPILNGPGKKRTKLTRCPSGAQREMVAV